MVRPSSSLQPEFLRRHYSGSYRFGGLDLVVRHDSDGGHNGLVTGTGVGSTTITATQAGVSGTTTVTVTSAVLTLIMVNPMSPSLALGTSTALTALGSFSDGSVQNITTIANWVSSDTTIAVVTSKSIRVTATGVGSAIVTATQAGVSGTATVTGTPAILTAITVTPVNVAIAKGTTAQLTAAGTFSDGSVQDITTSVSWVSTSTPVATVNSTGLVTGVHVGLATIFTTEAGVSSPAVLVIVTP